MEVEAEERDGCQNDGAEQDLSDVVVEDLVVCLREAILHLFGSR